MKRLIASIALLFATTAAWGQMAYDPMVAYTQLAGKTTYLYLANADGTHAVSVASSTKGINGIDFAPGGGRIAFHDRAAGLKVLSYTPLNSGIRVDAVKLVAKGPYYSAPDFSPDGSRIIYYAAAAAGNLYPTAPGIYVVPAAGGASVFLHRGADQGSIRWLRPSYGNAFAFLKLYPLNGQSIYEIWTVLLDGNDQVVGAGPVLSTTSQAFKAIEDFDTARTRDALLITANYPTEIRIVEFDLNSPYAITDKAGSTYRVHYSADDSRIISTDLHNLGSKEYVTSIDLETHLITRLSKAGNFGNIDARP